MNKEEKPARGSDQDLIEYLKNLIADLKTELQQEKELVAVREEEVKDAQSQVDILTKEVQYQNQCVININTNLRDLILERDRLKEENDNLCSVMIAAAEEIQEHWQAHCDEEGYGPANLMDRLEKGIPANYPGYKFGEFTKMQAEIDSLKEQLKQ